jgi:hypothetical protein
VPLTDNAVVAEALKGSKDLFSGLHPINIVHSQRSKNRQYDARHWLLPVNLTYSGMETHLKLIGLSAKSIFPGKSGI